jgi:hypothetical protein
LEVQAHGSTLAPAVLAGNGGIYAAEKPGSESWAFRPMDLALAKGQSQGMTTSDDKKPIVPGYVFSPFYSPWLMPTSRTPEGPGLMLRARVWRKKLELDAALAGGAQPARSEELELRAKQLVDRKTRNRLATAITRHVRTADGHRAPITTPGPPFTAKQVQANRSLLVDLADRLRGPRAVALPGMALTSLLLNDRRGPLTTESDPATLERAVRATLAAVNEAPHSRRKPQLPVGRSA